MNNIIPLYYKQIKTLIDYYGVDFILDKWGEPKVYSPTGEEITINHVLDVITFDKIEKDKIEREEALARKEILQNQYDFNKVIPDLFETDECPFIQTKSRISSK